MAYSDTLNLVAGDTLPELTLILRDSNAAASGKTLDPNNSDTWAPIDVTGATVKIRIRALGGSTVKSTLICTVTSGTDGKVITNFPPGTLSEAGTFEGEIEITFALGGVQTVYDFIKLKVRGDFD
jgi:hypothetical protein|tara:strand:+ start:428 stop:802 length:375 start_codon:yes stop_codon:yes gene_type:complete